MKMAITNIEVKVGQKILSVGNKELKLEDNFEGAGVFIVNNKKDETILELSYRKRENFSSYNEAEKINNFLRKSKIERIDEVHSTQEGDYKREVFPAVMILGNFNAIVYREQKTP